MNVGMAFNLLSNFIGAEKLLQLSSVVTSKNAAGRSFCEVQKVEFK